MQKVRYFHALYILRHNILLYVSDHRPRFPSAFTAHTRTFPISVSNVQNPAVPLRSSTHTATRSNERYWTPLATQSDLPRPLLSFARRVVKFPVFISGQIAVSAVPVDSQLQYGSSPTAPWDITYYTTLWNLKRNWAAYGYRKQRSVRGYGTKRLATPSKKVTQNDNRIF